MTITITNLTPHPVTIIRGTGTTTYPACAPADLPRATEETVGLDMSLTASDENAATLASTGLVDQTGYTGVEGLPPISRGDQCVRWYIVSVVTAIGALAGDRGIEDLLIPMGQVRDASGRIIGATGLAPATSLLAPLYRAIVAPHRAELMTALRERNEARRTVADLTRVREALDETMVAQRAQLERLTAGRSS